MLLIVPTAMVVVAGRFIARSPSLAGYARHWTTMWTARIGWLGIVSLGVTDLTKDTLALL
ncbi:MAG: hypothetical protein EXR65_02715 [Dehalococcoidia bacterium]|nr:hypothetical protein [Dehalococcoidia bacterium]